MADSRLIQLSREALFRHQVVSAVEVRVLGGMRLPEAIRTVVRLEHKDVDGQLRRVSERSLYRWLGAFQRSGICGLEPQPRPRTGDSTVLSRELLDFLRQEKQDDPEASIPEVIERARLQGKLGEDEPISRVSVWRACSRMRLPLHRVHKSTDKDMRRFQYPHRMLMVLADGKYFRAGVQRLKRVALNFIDDATRYGLGVIVGTSESTELFLNGLHKVILTVGIMKALFLDSGPGFISGDTRQLVARLGIHLIHGTSGYPEGHGKIERFNLTSWQRMLRSFDSNPEVDPAPSALTLRLSHWMLEVYNHKPHESLGGQSPAERWHADSRALQFPEDRAWLDDRFLLTFERRVSADNVIPFHSQFFELPLGYAKRRVQIFRNLLDGTLSIIHRGNRLELHPVNLRDNAYAKRATPTSAPSHTPSPTRRTAASLKFNHDFQPLVDSEGNYSQTEEKEHDS